jgi:hypothetical protein
LFVGTDEGDVYRSDDRGFTWLGIPPDSARQPVTSFVALSEDTVFCGKHGVGIFRSTNAGNDWRAVSEGLTHTGVSTLAATPPPSSILVAGTRGGGVYRSTDLGDSWRPVGLGIVGADVTGVISNVIGILVLGTKDAGVFYSSDAGQTWSDFNGREPGILSDRRVTGVYLHPDQRNPYLTTASGSIVRCYGSIPTALRGSPAPRAFSIRDVYPSPFHDHITAVYELERPGEVRLRLTDLLGREMGCLEAGFRDAGIHRADFRGIDVPSGTYILHVEAGSQSGSRLVVHID